MNPPLKNYSYGIPGIAIWSSHIAIGIILFYVGYSLINSKPINQWLAILLIVLGSLAVAYHGHLLYVNKS